MAGAHTRAAEPPRPPPPPSIGGSPWSCGRSLNPWSLVELLKFIQKLLRLILETLGLDVHSNPGFRWSHEGDLELNLGAGKLTLEGLT